MPAKKIIAEPAAAVLDDISEPEVLPEPIVEWQPTHGGVQTMKTTTAVGFFILGAVAIAAVALTAVAIDRATRD